MAVLSLQAPPITRPKIRKRQITSLCQIYKGLRLIVHEADKSEKLVQVTRGPYSEDGHIYLDYVTIKSNKNGGGSIYLGNYSVIRNDIGFWVENCWLERA